MPKDPRTCAEEIATAIAPRPAAEPNAAFLLAVTEGPDARGTLTLDGSLPSRAHVGKGPTCELRLTDPLVSRRHAAFELGSSSLRLTDLDSTNGTFVNGTRIGDAFLVGGEQIHVGASVLRVERIQASLQTPVSTAMAFGRVVGASLEMRRIYPLFEKLARSDVPLVIEGETGTGKELVAESLHETSARAAGPFVVFDCTTVLPSLVESELFGHERGAFTGAVATRQGMFEQADGGTLLIDEIGDLETALQSRLLRAIERQEIRRVGGDRWIKVDVRVMAATRRDLDHEVEAGRFRDDLFFRLAVARIELPPLRRREGDVALLARHFWRASTNGDTPLPYDLLRRFEDYAWPGNVRELHNAVARRLALGDAAPVHARRSTPPAPTDLVDRILAEELTLPEARQRLIDEFERRYIERVLERHGGSVAAAAAASGIARRYFNILRARSK